MTRWTLTVRKPADQDALVDPGEGYALLTSNQVGNLTFLLEMLDYDKAKTPDGPKYRTYPLVLGPVKTAAARSRIAPPGDQESVLRRVPDEVSPDLDYVILRLPSDEDMKEARRVAAKRRRGSEEYDVEILLGLFLQWPDPDSITELAENAAKWLGGEILKISDERSRRILRKVSVQRFSRDVLVFHCRQHEGFDDDAIRLVLGITNSRKPPRGNVRSYFSRGRKKVVEKLQGICPFHDETNLSVVLQFALSKGRELRDEAMISREAGVFEC